MHRAAMIAAVLSLAVGTAATAQTIPQTLRTDLNGRCRTPDGRTIRSDACKPQKNAPDGAHHLYMRNAQGLCHDEKGKPASAGSCKR
jgi:hypothetical protein